MITLYSYYRSSAAYRVRIALNIKQLEYSIVDINLLEGEEKSADYLALNPQGFVPAMAVDGQLLTQSAAIIEYLEERVTTPALLPAEPLARATVRAMANVIAADTHPLNNLRVLNYLVNDLNTSEAQKLDWYRHWISEGFTALEALLQKHSGGQFCYADSVTMADVFLIPQVYNAHRFEVDMSAFPLISAINAHCCKLAAFHQAAPEQQ